MNNEHKALMKNGMWENNPALVQLLGLCPLLAVSSTVTNALGLGIATLLVLVGSNVTVSLVRDYVPKEVRIPVFVMIIASLVTCVQLLMSFIVNMPSETSPTSLSLHPAKTVTKPKASKLFFIFHPLNRLIY